MARRVWPWAAFAAVLFGLAGCSVVQHAERPAWRAQAENVCLAQGQVKATAYTQPANAINGPGVCGLEHPLKVTALAGGTVALNATQTIGCPLTAALDDWVVNVVEPIAQQRFGEAVVRVNSMGSYSCRTIDNLPNKGLSEHAYGNAIDIGGFTLASGRSIVVVKDWTRGDEQTQAFLREVQAGACNIFTTVLAPGSDQFHYNHIHMDLAMHGRTSTGPRRYCKPAPRPQLLPPPGQRDGLPDAPDVEEDLDVARAPSPTPAYVARSNSAPRPPEAVARQASPRARAPRAGTIDENGVFTPEGSPGDWDVTSSVPRSNR